VSGPSRKVDGTVDDVVGRVRAALERQGFGIQCDLDIAGALRDKIGETVPPMRVLGACNPRLAARALRREPRIGTVLPCNVVVREDANGETIVEAVDATMMAAMFPGQGLEEIADEAATRLRAVLDSI